MRARPHPSRAGIGWGLALTLLAVAVAATGPRAALRASQQPAGSASPVFRTGTELVSVSVVVRDWSGNAVRGLTRDDFTVIEDDRPQAISTFDAEELDKALGDAPPAAPTEPVLGAKLSPARPAGGPGRAAPDAPREDLHGRRLVVLFFDLSSMEPEEVGRATAAARDYVDRRLTPADLVAVVSFATALRVDQDFTADRARLLDVIDGFGGASGQGFAEGTTGDEEGVPDTGGAFTPDDTEFNIFSTDRRLDALQSLAEALAGIEQKKSVVYFSSGMAQSGTDNQVQIRRTVDRAVRSNVSIYAADMRGLQALPPGGDATQASVRGVSAFSGASVGRGFDCLAATQDTLNTLAEDTGGRAFFDTNTFAPVFERVAADTSAYYVLGYVSTNPARDGRFRRIKLRVSRPDLKLEYRSGYYAGRDFAHSTRADREQQLIDQLGADLSATDLSTYLAPAFFRLAKDRYFVPVSVVVAGYQLPFGPATDRAKASVDLLALVRDAQQRPVARARDTIRLAPESMADLRRKNVQYQTGFELAPGKYRMKVVVRENQAGTFGSYETDLVVPDLARETLKVSSVVIGTQLQAGARSDDRNPLVRDGQALVPNVTRVVSTAQHLYFYFEVYDPATAGGAAGTPRNAPIRLLTNLAFYRGALRVYETPLVETQALTAPDRKAAVFRFDVPVAALQPGLYACQVNIVDDTAGTFAFPRTMLFVRR